MDQNVKNLARLMLFMIDELLANDEKTKARLKLIQKHLTEDFLNYKETHESDK